MSAPSVSKLEADVAYFDARLSMLGQPSTHYQKAQMKAYRALEGLLVKSLVSLRGRLLSLPDEVPQITAEVSGKEKTKKK